MNTSLKEYEELLDKTTTPSEKLKLLAEISFLRQHITDSKTTRYFHQMMRVAKAEGDILHQANALRYYSINLMQRGEFSKAKVNLMRATALLAQINNREFDGEIYRLLGIIDESKGDFTDALHHYYLALRFAEETNNSRTLLTICLALGTFFYSRLNDYKKAGEYYLRTYKLARSMQRRQMHAASCQYLAACYFQLDNIGKGKKYLDEGIKVAQRHQLSVALLHLKATLARYHRKMNDYKTSVRILEEVLVEATENSYTYLIQVGILDLAESYMHLKQWKKAEQAIRRYEKIRKEFSIESGTENLLFLKSELAKQKKDYPKAMRFLEQKLKIQEENYKRDWQQKMDILEQSFKMESYKKDTEIAKSVAKMRMDFLSNMSHEIRSPMNAVLGLSNLLLRKNVANDNTSNLQTIKASAEHLLSIINDILDVSKIDAGKLTIEHTAINIREVVTHVQKTLEYKAKEKNLTLRFQVENDVPMIIMSDSARITQILINLVNNALKFTEKGSVRILLSVEGKSRGKHVKLLFKVRDTGIGMSQEQSAKLFQRYEQADTDTFRKFGGTGLGLHISKQLTELMGGKISVESKPGKGSVFSVLLPMKVSTTQQTSVIHRDYTRLKTKTYLLVEDNETDMTILSETLVKHLGEEVRMLKATNGKEALRLLDVYQKQAQGNGIDFLITDLDMPEMNGFELAEIIKKNFPDSKVIAITAALVPFNTEQLHQEGFNALINKPIKIETLMETIFSLLV